MNSKTKRDDWERIQRNLARKATRGWNNQHGFSTRTQIGRGPNKASGHKGGISRQGSKRG